MTAYFKRKNGSVPSITHSKWYIIDMRNYFPVNYMFNYSTLICISLLLGVILVFLFR